MPTPPISTPLESFLAIEVLWNFKTYIFQFFVSSFDSLVGQIKKSALDYAVGPRDLLCSIVLGLIILYDIPNILLRR